MQLQELEKAVRTAMLSNPGQPARAVLGADGSTNGHLPTEFDIAAKSLAARLVQKPTEPGAESTAGFEWM